MPPKTRLSIAYGNAGGLLYYRDNMAARNEMNEYLVSVFGLDGPPLTTYRQITDYLRDDLNAGKLAPEEWARRLLAHLKLEATEAQAKEFLDFYVENRGHYLARAPGALEALTFLYERGVPYWILTDTFHAPIVTRRWLERLELPRPLVAEVLTSRELGSTKKNRDVFKKASERSRVPPHESVFIGHTPAEIWGAKRAGFLAVSLQRVGDEDYHLASLERLPSLLQSVFNVPPAR